MDLRATINGTQYDILQGATFAEEFNETLDSGSIIINNVQKIKDLMPYDDVYIYSFTDPNYKFKGYPFDENNPRPKFYKHLLVDQFTEEVLRLGDKEEEGRYKYKIELMSETKKLETIQLPNISITQPIKGEKNSVYEYAKMFVGLYSPIYKKVVYNDKDIATDNWAYDIKYTLAPEIESIFTSVYSPDFVLNTPSLRALLSKLFLTKDMIPYVQDDVIYAMDISKRGNKFDANPKYVNIITGSRTSDNHCDNLRRNYTDALSRDRSCRSVEYVGFRNSDNALMTISNMRLELGMPIYKINKIYLCYYKNIKVNYYNATDSDGNSLASKGIEDGVMLCKQDISKLVKLNTERNLLSQDWEDLQETNPPQSVDDMAKYKFCTVGYDIGSKYITGWGDIYTYPTFWNDNQYTSVQNIVSKLDYFYPFGIYDESYVAKQFGNGVNVYSTVDDSFWRTLVTETTSKSNGSVDMFFNTVESAFTNPSLKLKGLFFIVDYEGFYNGTIVHSKKNERDDIAINDNASESLTLIEQDAVYQTEKVNRFGNKALQINARYDTFFDDNGNELLQPLASVYESSYEDDVVIYHREYSIFNNCIQCTYYGTKNYVLKNWFTSVYARYRTWNLMSYNESVKRSENEKNYIFWSEKESYYEVKTQTLFNSYGTIQSALAEVISCFTPWTLNNVSGIYEFTIDSKVNYAAIEGYKETGAPSVRYSSDLNAFVANNSLCFNVKMFDNFSQGVYISQAEPMIGKKRKDGTTITESSWTTNSEEWWMYFTGPATSDYSGSKQDYYPLVNDIGETPVVSFEVGKQSPLVIAGQTKAIDIFKSDSDKSNLTATVKDAYTTLFQIPKIWGKTETKLKVRGGFNKDNKSYMDMTMQVENFSLSKNVVFSPWAMRLSDLLADYPKFDTTFEDKTRPINGGYQVVVSGFESIAENAYQNGVSHLPILTVKISQGVMQAAEDSIPYSTACNIVFCRVSQDQKANELIQLNFTYAYLLKFNCTSFTFYKAKTELHLHGTLDFAYKANANASATETSVGFTFVLKLQNSKKSLASSIMPGAKQDAEEYGDNPQSNMVLFYSGLYDGWGGYSDIPPTYVNSYISKDGLYIFPNRPAGFIGGYQDGATWTYGRFNFGVSTEISHLVTDLGLSVMSSKSSWSGKNILTLAGYTTGSDIIYDPARYATYYKNMFLHYSDKELDSKFLQEEYKYSEIYSRQSYTELVFGTTGDIADIDGYYYSGSITPIASNIKDVIIKTYDGTKASASYRNGKISYRIYSGNEPNTTVSATIIYSSVDHFGDDWSQTRRVSDYFVPIFNGSTEPPYIVLPSIHRVKNADGVYMDNKLIWDADIESLLTYESLTMNIDKLYAPFPSGLYASDILIVSKQGNCFRATSIGKNSKGETTIDLQKDASLTAERIKSLSYWYLDDFKNGYQKDIDNMGYISKFDYDPNDCYMHFVFGVNIPSETEVQSISQVPRKIYLSLMTKKDLRVFDKYNQVVGKVENEVVWNKYGKGQYFTKKS